MTLSAVYRSLVRHRLLLVLMTAIAAAAGWHFDASRPPVYRSTATIQVQQSVNDPADALGALETTGRLAPTYVELATTLPVAQAIERSLAGRVPLDAIAGSVTAKQVGDLDLLDVTATSNDAETAYLIASRAQAALSSSVARVPGERLSLVQPALLPARPFSPRPLVALLLAALLGLVLNATLLFAYDLVTDRAITGRSADFVGGLPVIAQVPELMLTTAAAITLPQLEHVLEARRAGRD